MKRILFALLLVPTLAYGQIAEEWTTYCDGGVEKVRVSITYYIDGDWYTFHSAQVAAYSGEACNGVDCGWRYNAVFEPLGNSEYLLTLEGWPRECFTVPAVSRHGQIVFRIELEDGGYTYSLLDLFCDDFSGSYTLQDTSECPPLPAASSTWGAVKALYR